MKIQVITPTDYYGPIMDLTLKRRGVFKQQEYPAPHRVQLDFEIPLAELIVDFFDELNSRTRGYIDEQLSHTLEYAHQHKVLHRDIKPSNLMIKSEPGQGIPFRVILTDLGLAKLLEGQGLTLERSALGTPAYMSPEQASGQDTDARNDVYSLGVLLYELAVGRLPYPIRTVTDAVRYHTRENPPTPRSVKPDLPEPLERVFLKALEKDPSTRYPSAAALGTVLAGISSTSIEMMKPGKTPGDSLITVHENNASAPPSPPKPGAGNPRTILQGARDRLSTFYAAAAAGNATT